MNQSARRIICVTFAIIAAFAILLALATLVLKLLLNPPGDPARGTLGIVLYFTIALVSCYVVWRIRHRDAKSVQGFPVLRPEDKNKTR
jgi:hypothetical protein